MIESMNKELSKGSNNEEIEAMISELKERNEFSCTANATCPINICPVD